MCESGLLDRMPGAFMLVMMASKNALRDAIALAFCDFQVGASGSGMPLEPVILRLRSPRIASRHYT